jgi:hypothetical protein
MTQDPEIDAMARLKEVLTPLDEETRAHVIFWAAERFGVTLSRRRSVARAGREAPEADYEDAGSLFADADPSTEAEKALTVGYWFQVVKGQENFDGASVNAQLKNLGHGATNITRAFNDLKARRPALALQVQKSGKAKQARKKYKLTEAGLAHVERRLTSGEPEKTEGGA